MENLDRRSRKTRIAINNAFWNLMHKKDFEDITIRDITEEADIHRATFYLHYEDKYDLLEKNIREIFYKVIEYDEALLATNTSFSYEILLSFVLHCDEYFDFYSIMLHNRGTLFFEKTFKEILLERQKMRYNFFTGNLIERELSIQFYTSAVAGSIEWWIKNNRPLTPENLAHQLYELLRQFPDWKEL